MWRPRVDVRRSNGREVEIVRDVDLATARRIVERDLATGTVSTIETRPTVAESGRVQRDTPTARILRADRISELLTETEEDR